VRLSQSKSLDLLFARLKWPSSVTRGKAAAAAARLLATTETREETLSSLTARLQSETLEACSADLLIPVLMARQDLGSDVIPPQRLHQEIRFPSILSHLIFEELGFWEDRKAWETFHSGAAPAGFLIDRYFERNLRESLPPLYKNLAEEIETNRGTQLFKQWAFESKILLDRTGLAAIPPAHFPGQAREDELFFT
jgi:hypothetical protein